MTAHTNQITQIKSRTVTNDPTGVIVYFASHCDKQRVPWHDAQVYILVPQRQRRDFAPFFLCFSRKQLPELPAERRKTF